MKCFDALFLSPRISLNPCAASFAERLTDRRFDGPRVSALAKRRPVHQRVAIHGRLFAELHKSFERSGRSGYAMKTFASDARVQHDRHACLPGPVEEGLHDLSPIA